MRLKYCGGFATIVLLFAGNLLAQYPHFVPVIAKTRVTEETIRAGKVIKKEIKEGVYYRSDDGSIFRRITSIDGDRQAALRAVGQLWDNHTAINYHLDFIRRIAYEREHGPGPTQPRVSDPEAASKLPLDSVDGIGCRVYPVKFMKPGQTGLEDIGQNCRSVKYYLTLSWDKTFKMENGDSFRTVFRMFDIRVGAEPDPQWFDLQGNFKVYGQQQGQPQGGPPNR